MSENSATCDSSGRRNVELVKELTSSATTFNSKQQATAVGAIGAPELSFIHLIARKVGARLNMAESLH